MLFGRRPKLSIGMITGKPASIDNKYVPGSGVGASSISARRAKSRLSRPPHISNNGVADPPTNIRAELVEGTIVVSWTSPIYIGDSGIISYTVTSSPGGNKITTTGTTATFTDLTEDAYYTFTVITRNYGGNSTSSDESNSVKMAVNASAPIILLASSGNEFITITFTESQSVNEKVITNYEYSIDGTTYTEFYPPVTTSPVTISGLTNGTTYTIKLRAVTTSGAGVSTSVTIIPYTTPSAPTILSGERGDEEVTIYFTQGNNGGSEIINYQYSTNDGITYFNLSPTDNESPVTIAGLINGREYTIYLRAVNISGEGIASTPITITPYTIPSSPVITSVIPGDEKVTILFTEGNDGGNAITKYQYSLGEEYIDISVDSATTSLTITELINGNIYTIYLRAVNAAGNGVDSEMITVTPYTIPGSPASLSATEGNGETTLTFTSPITNGGSEITTYKYTFIGGSEDISGNTTTSPVTVSGLTNGITYTISLVAINAGGSGDAITTTATPYTTASAPIITTITTGDGEATIYFTAPDNGGRPITKYQYSKDGGTTYSDLSSTATSLNITGLTNGISYVIMIQAVTSAGLGAVLSRTITVYTTPGPPTGLEITGVGSAYVEISFTAPLNTGGSALTNYQYSIGGGAFNENTYTAFSPVDTTSPVKVTGLTNGTEYTIRLKAVNAQGGGSASESISAMSYTTPGQPLSLSATAGNGQVTIAFTEGTTGGKPITNYQYSLDGTNYTSLTTPDSTSPVTITGLTNGTEYTITLKAVNMVGAGVASESITSTPI